MQHLSTVAFGVICLGLTAAAVPEKEIPIVASGDTWSYYAKEGAPETNWSRGGGFKGWKTGRTVIGWGEADQKTAFTAKKGASKRFPVAYFRKKIRVPSSARAKNLHIILNCDDGCIAFVNGQEVGRARLPEGPPVPYTAQAAFMKPTNVFSIPREILRKENYVAVAVYQVSDESSDMRFDARIVAR